MPQQCREVGSWSSCLLLIIDPSTWVVGEQDRHRHDNIPITARTADHASAIRI